MAEDKTKAAGETQQPDSKKKANGDTPAPAPSKGSRFADKFGRLLNLCTELKNDHGGALDYEATLKENATLQSTVDRCKGEISSLEAQVRQLEASRSDNLELYGKKYGEYMTKLNDIDSSKQAFAETSKKLGDANKRIKELEGENKLLDKKTRTAAAELKQATRKLSESQAECKHLQASLQLAQNQIRYYGEDKLTLANLNEMEHKFTTFANYCHTMVMECFEPCEEPPTNINPLVNYLNGLPGCQIKLPLSNRTSMAARRMRCAAAELVIANVMAEHIFTDIYLPGEVDKQRAVSSTLELLAQKEPKREMLVRCQLLEELSADSEILSAVESNAFKEICKYLDHLLPAGNLLNEFHAKLKRLLREAVQLWHPLQRSESRVSAYVSVTPDMLNRDDDAWDDYDKRSNQHAVTPSPIAFQSSQPVVILFPLICANDQMVAPPMALWSDQGAFVEAKNEEDRSSVGRGAVGMNTTRSPTIQRRMSSSARSPTLQGSAQSIAGPLNGGPPVSGSHLSSASRRSDSSAKLAGNSK